MASDPLYQPITVDEFLAMDFGSDRKFELDNGVIRMMTGGSVLHAHVAGNVYLALRLKFASGGCRPFNSEMGVRTGPTTIRYPDVSVVCRPDWSVEGDGRRSTIPSSCSRSCRPRPRRSIRGPNSTNTVRCPASRRSC